MADDPGTQDPKTFTQEEVDALVKEANAGLEANRDEALERYKKAQAKLKAFDGLDADEVKERLAKLAELEQKGQAQKAGLTDDQLKKLREDIRNDLEKEYAPFKSRADELNAKVRELQLDNEVKKVMAASGVRAERVDALFQLTRAHFDLTEDGKPMVISPAATGKEVDKYCSDDLATMFPEFYQGSGSSGGGAPKSTVGRTGSVSAGDNAAFLQNLEKIAKGEIRVTE